MRCRRFYFRQEYPYYGIMPEVHQGVEIMGAWYILYLPRISWQFLALLPRSGNVEKIDSLAAQ